MKKIWTALCAILVMASPLLKGGETFHTALGVRILVLAFGMAYFTNRAGKGKIEFMTPAHNWLLMALLLVFCASLLTSHYFYVSGFWLSNLLVYFLLFYLGLEMAVEAGGKKNLNTLFFIFLASGLVQSGFGIFEFLARGQARAAGTFFNPSYYAGYLAGLLGFPLAGAVFDLWPEMSLRKKIWLRAGLGLAALLIFLGMVVSGSRVIFFAVIPLGLVLGARFRWKALLALLAVALVLGLIPNPLRHRLQTIRNDRYAWERLTVWKASCRMIRHHPLGVGLGMYPYYYHRFSLPMGKEKVGRYGVEATQAHNELLTFAAECSALAPLFALLFLALILARVWKGLAGRALGRGELGWITALAGCIFGIAGHALVDFNLHQPPIIIAGLLSLAGALAFLSEKNPGLLQKEEYGLARPGLVRAFVVIAGVLFSVFIIYQAGMEFLYLDAARTSDPKQRAKKFSRLVRLPASYAPVYFQMAEDLRRTFLHRQEAGLGRQAAIYYEIAARLNPENYLYYYEWAECVYRMGALLRTVNIFNEAETLATRASELAPDQVFSYVLLFNIAYVKKDNPQAEQYLRTALDFEPYFLRARTLLVAMLITDDKLPQAEQEYQKLLAQKKEVDELLALPGNDLNIYQKLLLTYDPDAISRIPELLRQKSAGQLKPQSP